MKTIYKTIGAAKEYCDYALDIFNGCPHGCTYCFNKLKAEKKNNKFEYCGIRNVYNETENFLKENKEVWGKTIFLGFSSDPLPNGYIRINEYVEVLNIIDLLHKYNCKVMFCTKNGIKENHEDQYIYEIIKASDSVGITLTCGEEMASKYEPNAATPYERLELLRTANDLGNDTWISFEPVLEPSYVIDLLKSGELDFVTKLKFGKLNHTTLSELTNGECKDVDWESYANEVVKICEEKNYDYMIKEALKKEM